MINLIIVNCQSDFITGTRGAKGVRNYVENIKKYIKAHENEIEKIIFTIEWHPYNHCSFKRYGGEFPPHCVQFTPGACIEPKLLKFVQSKNIEYSVITRGDIEKIEEQGAFTEIEYCNDVLGSHCCLDNTTYVDSNSEFVVCGMNGEVSVKQTIQNLLSADINPKIYCPGIHSKDGGKAFSEFIKENNLEKTI